MKVETFETVNEALNFVLDKQLDCINIQKFQYELEKNHAYQSRIYETIFLIDEQGILANH